MNITIDRKKAIIIIAALIIIALVALVKFYVWPKMQAASNAYSVVYVSTGEAYIGRLSTWPKMEMKDAYILKAIKDANDPNISNFQLTPLKEAVWAPKYLVFDKKNVIFYGPLEESSKAAEAIRNAKK